MNDQTEVLKYIAEHLLRVEGLGLIVIGLMITIISILIVMLARGDEK